MKEVEKQEANSQTNKQANKQGHNSYRPESVIQNVTLQAAQTIHFLKKILKSDVFHQTQMRWIS
jgi:hypothetical protein